MLAIFQVGHRNRYHHPKAQVVARYDQLGIHSLRSDRSGAITLLFGAHLQAWQYRTEHARYWYGR